MTGRKEKVYGMYLDLKMLLLHRGGDETHHHQMMAQSTTNSGEAPSTHLCMNMFLCERRGRRQKTRIEI